MKNLTHATVLCTLVFVSSVSADSQTESVSLGCDSRNEVAFSSLKGAVAGFGAFAGLYALTNNFKFPTVTKHPYGIALSTLAGAIIGGWWKYQYTPEKHFEFARTELLRIAQNELFGLLITTEPDTLISTLKDRYFREKLPLYTAFKQLDRICLMVDRCKESLAEVLASTRADLYQESNELQMIADMYLVILKDVFKQLKNDPNFIAECNAGTLELMKDAQEAAAQAAESSAFTQQMAYISSHHNSGSAVSTHITV